MNHLGFPPFSIFVACRFRFTPCTIQMTRAVYIFFPLLFAVFDLFPGTDVEVKYRAEFEPQNPARAGRTRRPDGCPSGLDRQTDRLLAQGHDLSRLNPKRDGGSAPIF